LLQVALGQPFTVNVAYQTDIKRPVDIHVDVLNAQTKAFYAGTTIPMDFQKGQVSATVKMSDYAQEPFLWKVRACVRACVRGDRRAAGTRGGMMASDASPAP
jgi:hypothetical protein